MKCKTVWKLAPYEPFEVDAIAGWLDELSRKGLQFRTKFGPVCIFDRRNSPARYRVDPGRIALDPKEEERIDAYRHFGWEYCSDYTKYAEVYRAEDPDAPELHTDPDLLDGLVKRTIRDQLGRCLVFLFPAVQMVSLTADIFTHWAANRHDPAYLSLLLICSLFLLILLMTVVLLVAAALRWKKRLETVIHTPRRARWGTFWRGLRFVLIVLCVVGWLWALTVVTSSNSTTYYWE